MHYQIKVYQIFDMNCTKEWNKCYRGAPFKNYSTDIQRTTQDLKNWES